MRNKHLLSEREIKTHWKKNNKASSKLPHHNNLKRYIIRSIQYKLGEIMNDILNFVPKETIVLNIFCFKGMKFLSCNQAISF